MDVHHTPHTHTTPPLPYTLHPTLHTPLHTIHTSTYKLYHTFYHYTYTAYNPYTHLTHYTPHLHPPYTLPHLTITHYPLPAPVKAVRRRTPPAETGTSWAVRSRKRWTKKSPRERRRCSTCSNRSTRLVCMCGVLCIVVCVESKNV